MEHSHEYSQVASQTSTAVGFVWQQRKQHGLQHISESSCVLLCVSIYPCTGIERMLLMLANIVLKWSGSFLKPISVSTRDWLMSWKKRPNSVCFSPLQTVTDQHLSVRCGSVQLSALYSMLLWYRLHLVDWLQTATLQAGATCSGVCTFLSRHLDWFSVAECSFAFPRCVHFVLDAAVDDPKLNLRRTSSKDLCVGGRQQTEEPRKKRKLLYYCTGIHRGMRAITALIFLIINNIKGSKDIWFSNSKTYLFFHCEANWYRHKREPA